MQLTESALHNIYTIKSFPDHYDVVWSKTTCKPTSPTYLRRVLDPVHPEDELLGHGIEVGVGGLAAGDGSKVLLHLLNVIPAQVGYHLFRLQELL